MEYQRAETGRKGGGGKMVKKRKNMNELWVADILGHLTPGPIFIQVCHAVEWSWRKKQILNWKKEQVVIMQWKQINDCAIFSMC